MRAAPMTYKQHRPSYSYPPLAEIAGAVQELWQAGLDTVGIARVLGRDRGEIIRESHIEAALIRVRETDIRERAA